MKPLNASLSAALAAVRASSPALSSDVARAVGRSHNHVQSMLRALRDRGLIECTNRGRFSQWCLPEQRAAIIAAENAHSERRAQAVRRSKRLRAQERLAAELDAWAEPKRRSVSALACPPICRSGPNSVFQLAQWSR